MRMSQQSTIYYAALRERGGRWDVSLPIRQQEQWDQHAAFMDALAEEGFIILGGPLGVEARLAEDPWTPLRMLRTVSIERWEILLRAGQ
jgi:hypothetical protein